MGYNERSIFATQPYKEHRERRKLTSAFYQASAVYKRPEIEGRIRDRVQAVLNQIHLEQNNTETSETDVYCLTDRFALDNITYLVLGPSHCSQTVECRCQERQILRELKYLQLCGPFRLRFPLVFTLLSQISGTLFPSLSYLQAEDRLADWSYRRFTEAIRDPALSDPHTLLQRLLKIGHDQGDDKTKALDYKFIAAEVLDNINAAEATVAVTATYLIWRLSKHPWWQRRLRDELRALPIQKGGLPSFADINNHVPVLEACLREVTRLHPASSGRAERVIPYGGHTLSGVYVPGKTIVTTSVVSLHRDENIFPAPDQFFPKRWLEGSELDLKKRNAHLIPFGYGGRICLGKPFAIMEIKMLAAGLYLRYETLLTASSTTESMKQCSTHDAVPRALQCVIQFRDVNLGETSDYVLPPCSEQVAEHI
ncbi:MAG: hypothetical protein M1835_001251 [Candelina submexicana]|nr:MAG: hypothetical protein M1835_001251 [Candelina submexicana]